MKKLVLLVTVSLLFAFSGVAQETTSQKELGIIFKNLDQFGISYKFGNSNAMWRVRGVSLSLSSTSIEVDDEPYTDPNSFGIGVAFGREWRKPLNDKVELAYGAELALYYQHQKFETTASQDQDTFHTLTVNTTAPALNFVFGCHYLFNENLSLGFEVLPGVSYQMQDSDSEYTNGYPEASKSTSNTFSCNISSWNAFLNLAFRF